MNEHSKKKMLEQKIAIVDGLKAQFPDIPFFEDEIAEDEEKKFVKNKYHAYVLMMGDFIRAENQKNLTQLISIDYYSEDRDDVDEMLLDTISIVDKVPTVDFLRTRKMRARKANTDRFVDVITIEFRRSVKYEC